MPKRICRPYTDQDTEFIRQNFKNMPYAEIGARLGRDVSSIRNKVYFMGLSGRNRWTNEEIQTVREVYEAAGNGGVDVKGLSKRLNRSEVSISKHARKMGLTRRSRPTGRKERTIFKGDKKALKEWRSRRSKEYIEKNGHPRGMAGKKHSAETKQKLSKSSSAWWNSLTEEQRQAHSDILANHNRINGAPKVKRGSWAAGWRTVGDKKIYFRSRWEANYAYYLEWLKGLGEIQEWEYEPITYWFHEIKRGVRSYKPDFRVVQKNGESELHEVKGWMDSRSRTTLKRMAKYYPEETVILIDAKTYKSIRRSVMGLVPGWEDGRRDRRI